MAVHHRIEPVVWLLIAAILLVGGCSSTSDTAEINFVFYPPPPVEPRVQFLTSAAGSPQVEIQQTGFAEFAFGEELPPARLMIKPYGLAARDGVVYVCDTKALNVARLDFKNRTFSVIGTTGSGALRKPINLVIDSLGFKFVADTIRKQVVVFGPDDEFRAAYDVPKPCRPVDVAVWEDELFVLDNDDTPRVVVMDRRSGEVKRTFGEVGHKPGTFGIPSSICAAPDGHIYVSDTMNCRIQKLTRQGEVVWVRGERGRMMVDFVRPRGIRVGPDGIVFVAEGAMEHIKMYDASGQILMGIGGPGIEPGQLVLPSSVALDATSIPYFKDMIHPDFQVRYLVFVASQFGPNLVSVFAFGRFPEGFDYPGKDEAALPSASPTSGGTKP